MQEPLSEDYPAHPQKTVTAKSLKKAFEKERMTRQSAAHLLSMLLRSEERRILGEEDRGIRQCTEYDVKRFMKRSEIYLEQPALDLPDAVKIIGNSLLAS